jgi:hypothetical protein
MPSMTNFAVTSVAFATLIQFCPAPFLAGIGAAVAANIGTISGVVGAASGVAGTVVGAVNGKRDIPAGLFRRQEEYGTGTAWQDCHDQLTSATVTFSSPAAGCMSLPSHFLFTSCFPCPLSTVRQLQLYLTDQAC